MGDRLEERKDFSADVAVKLPEATKLAEVGRARDCEGRDRGRSTLLSAVTGTRLCTSYHLY